MRRTSGEGESVGAAARRGILVGFGAAAMVVAVAIATVDAACATLGSACAAPDAAVDTAERRTVRQLVESHATAWETGDTALLREIIHDSVIVAYPRHLMDKEGWLRELAAFSKMNTDTRVYVHAIVVDGPDFALEWQFATTEVETGIRTAVSDAIIGRIEDGRIIVWKEYLDGRVLELQRAGKLELREGMEPMPWPLERSPAVRPPRVIRPESPPPDRRSSPDAPGSGMPRS